MSGPTRREAAGAVIASWRDRETDSTPEVTEALDELLKQILSEYALSDDSLVGLCEPN